MRFLTKYVYQDPNLIVHSLLLVFSLFFSLRAFDRILTHVSIPNFMLLGPIMALFGHIPFIIASSLPNKYTTTASFDDNYGNRLVFCHFMVWHSGIPY
jgi:hypothetical protein